MIIIYCLQMIFTSFYLIYCYSKNNTLFETNVCFSLQSHDYSSMYILLEPCHKLKQISRCLVQTYTPNHYLVPLLLILLFIFCVFIYFYNSDRRKLIGKCLSSFWILIRICESSFVSSWVSEFVNWMLLCLRLLFG